MIGDIWRQRLRKWVFAHVYVIQTSAHYERWPALGYSHRAFSYPDRVFYDRSCALVLRSIRPRVTRNIAMCVSKRWLDPAGVETSFRFTYAFMLQTFLFSENYCKYLSIRLSRIYIKCLVTPRLYISSIKMIFRAYVTQMNGHTQDLIKYP